MKSLRSRLLRSSLALVVVAAAAVLMWRISGPEVHGALEPRAGPEGRDDLPVMEELHLSAAREPAVPRLEPDPELAARIESAQARDAIAGTVLDADGAPLEGARCTLSPGRPAGGLAPELALDAGRVLETRSDPQGRFRLPVDSGLWRLEVRSSGYGPWSEDHLRGGDRRQVQLERASFLSVSALDEGGAPVVDVELRVLGDFRDLTGARAAMGHTDASGTCRLGPLAPGSWYLSALHPQRRRVHQPIEVPADAALVSVDLVLERGVRLVGRVEAREAGATLADLSLRIEAFALGQSVVLEPSCGPDGSFATDAQFAPGEMLTVSARARGFAEVERTIALDPALAPGGEQELRLELGTPERVLRGRTVDAEGRPVPGVDVRLVVTSPLPRGLDGLQRGLARVTPHAERWRKVGRTDADGRFEIARLAAGRQHVVALLAAGWAPAFAWPPDGQAGETHELGDVRLERAGGVYGVARFDDETPAAGLEVRAQREIVVRAASVDTWRPESWWRPLAARTDAHGAFRIDALAAGEYELFVDGRTAGLCSVVAGQPTGPLALDLSRPDAPVLARARLTGVVRDAGQLPVASVFVGVYDAQAGEDQRPLAMTFTDTLGRFELAAPAGPVLELRASDPHARFLMGRETLGVLERAGERDLVLEADPGGREPLEGMVLTSRGEPLAGAEVSLEPPENRWCNCISIQARSGADGTVSFARLADRDHTVRVRDPGGVYREKVIAGLRPGGWFEVVLGD
jgi:hypothetical protein